MSEFDEHKKRMPSPVHPAARHDYHTRNRTDAASPKGARAQHDALKTPPGGTNATLAANWLPGRHQLSLGGGPLSSYQDGPGLVAKPLRTQGASEASAKQTNALRQHLWAEVEAGRMSSGEAEDAMVKFQRALHKEGH